MVQANKKSVEMKVHAIDEALALVKEGAKAKFDESIDMVIQLGVDTRKHAVRGSVFVLQQFDHCSAYLAFAKISSREKPLPSS